MPTGFSAAAREAGQAGLSWDVLQRLRARGVRLEEEGHEDPAARADRFDTALMALWRDSADLRVFEELYRHARSRVLAWLRWLAKGDAASSDPLELLQDTFVNVFRYSASFRDEGPESFRRWARTVAGNVLRRSLSRSGASRRGQFSLQALAGDRRELVDPSRGPHLRLVEGEEEAVLARTWLLFLGQYSRAYARLSARDRLALQLVEIEGLTYAQTGDRLGVSPSNMKMIMLRSRRRLLKHLRAALERGSASRATAEGLGAPCAPRVGARARLIAATA